MTDNEITHEIIGAAMEVHKRLGPGLLEAAYEECLLHELRLRNLRVDRQLGIPVVYKEVKLDCGYRLDLLVEGRVIVELKSIEGYAPIHDGDPFDLPSAFGAQDWSSHQLQCDGIEGRGEAVYRVGAEKNINTEGTARRSRNQTKADDMPPGRILESNKCAQFANIFSPSSTEKSLRKPESAGTNA